MKSSDSTRHAARALAAVLAFAVLCLPAVPAQAEPEEADFINLMTRYLKLAEKFTELASSREAAIYFALEGIVEIHESRGELDQAIVHLEKALEEHGDSVAVRNLVRFKLRDLYNQTGNSKRALEQLDKIIADNAD